MEYRFKELKLDPDELEELKDEILTKSHPLGNKAFEYTNDRYNPDLYQLLFNWHPDHFHEDKGVRPSIILGRRGSGKSSYLNNLSHKEGVIAIPLNSWDVVDIIERQVGFILDNQLTVDAEKVADIWHLVLLTVATRAALDISPDDEKLQKVLGDLPLSDFANKPYIALTKYILERLCKNYLDSKDTYFDSSLIIQSLGLGCQTLGEWEKVLSSLAKKRAKTFIIMIDNPERLEPTVDRDWGRALGESYADASKPRWQTYAGLLTLLAHFNEGKVGIQVRYCVSAEQYFFLQDRSSAILKDFSNIQVLHWSSGEILSALAHRYMVYLQLYPNNRSELRYQQLKQIPIYDRKGAFEFFEQVFESQVINNRGHEEDTITYLLRHTQLLPRQILFYVNEAIRLALRANPDYDLTRLSALYLKQAINHHEALCAKEIIDSYRSAFPEGKELINSIDGIRLISTIATIKKDWASLGAKKVINKYSDFPEVTVESDRFIRFLLEVGIVGRTSKAESFGDNGYLNAVFEYNLPQRMHINSEDEVAIHPIFSTHASQNRGAELSTYKGIYPRGTELEYDIDKSAIKAKYIRS